MKTSKISNPIILKIKNFIDVNGILTPIYLNKFKYFKPKRMFIASGNKNFIRGDHAHKKCSQVFIPITGKMEIIISKKKKYKFNLDSNKKKMLLVPPMHWGVVKFKENKSSLLVLCDIDYSPHEYIRNPKQFKKILINNK